MGIQCSEIPEEFYFPPGIMYHTDNQSQTSQTKTTNKKTIDLNSKEGPVTFVPPWITAQIFQAEPVLYSIALYCIVLHCFERLKICQSLIST